MAQTVAVMALEPGVDKVFHGDSYGYRPGRSPLDAVRKCRERRFTRDWVVDLDVKTSLTSVPWRLMPDGNRRPARRYRDGTSPGLDTVDAGADSCGFGADGFAPLWP